MSMPVHFQGRLLARLIIFALAAAACDSAAPAAGWLPNRAATPSDWPVDGGQPVWDERGFVVGVALIVAAGVAGGFWWRFRTAQARSWKLEAQVANRTRYLAALNAVAAVAGQSLHIQETLTGALDKTLEVTGLEAGGIYLLKEDGQRLIIKSHRGLDEALVQAIDNLKVGEGVCGRVIQTGETTVVRNMAADARLTRLAAGAPGLRTLAVAPLTARGEVLGAMFLTTRRDREFSPREIELFTSIGRQIGMAVENARLYEETTHRLAQLTALQETNRALVSTLELNGLLEMIIQQAATLLKADGGILNLADWDKMEDEVVAWVGLVPNLLGHRAPLEGGLSGWVTLHKQPVISNRLREDPRIDPEAMERFSELPMRNAAVAPLMVKDRAIGTLVVVDKLGGAGEFEPADLDLLISFANQAATAIENARLFEAEERRAEQFRVIAEVGRRFALTLEITDLLAQVVRLIQEAFDYYHVGIGLIEGDEVVYRVGAGELWDDPQFQFRPGRLKVGAEGLTGWVAGSGQPLLVPDVSREPRYVWMQGSRTRSELVVPIKAKGQTIGVLDVQSDRLNDFDDDDVNVLQSLASQAAAAIENARLYAAEQRRAEQFRVLTEVSQRITSILDIDELLAQVVKLIQETFGYYHVEIGLIEADELVFRIGAGDLWREPELRAGPSRLRVGREGVSGWVAATGRALRVPDVSREPRYIPVKGSQARSELTVPISATGKVIGVLDIESDRLNDFDDTDLDLMISLANQTGVAIENARLYQQAPQAAVTEERSRLARDLHDSVTQSLYGITLYSQAAAGHLAAGRLDKVADHLHELQDTSQDALAEMRLLIFELRPPILAEEGLAAALQARLLAVEGRAGLKTEFRCEMQGRLPLVVEEGLYRIAQEALNNCLRHAHARRIVVSLCRTDQKAAMTIADDGVGFDPATARGRGGLGLSDMEERIAPLGGRLEVRSQPGEGARVCVEVCV